jgi:hypothetical protein
MLRVQTRAFRVQIRTLRVQTRAFRALKFEREYGREEGVEEGYDRANAEFGGQIQRGVCLLTAVPLGYGLYFVIWRGLYGQVL